MKVKVSDYFGVTVMYDGMYGNKYYKITDKVSKRFCYSTPKMLNYVLKVLLKCLHDGYYKLKNSFTIDYKVLKIFLDEDMAKDAKEELRIKQRTKRLKSYLNAHVEWKCVNEYLEKRKWYIDYSKAQ